MINKVYRLTSPRQIQAEVINKNISDEVIVRPTALSICAADKRYYYGLRDSKILKDKLPMALIHEGVGEVVFDPTNEFSVGDTVVMIPNNPTLEQLNISTIDENYIENVKFRGSGFDGFMQDYVFIRKDRLVKYNNIDIEVAPLLELTSVAMSSISRLDKLNTIENQSFGIWGDGNLGFITALILKNKYPNSTIYVFGKNKDKLQFFSFVDYTFEIDDIPNDLKIDNAFEAVGGNGSQYALEQIVNMCNPQGVISLLGVSENPISINTRLILEKGILLLGNSRSSRNDFIKSVEFIDNNNYIQNQLHKLVTAVVDIKSIDDIYKSFEIDLYSKFKTILLWNI